MDHTIDAVDYAILKCLDETSSAWKKQVHQLIIENIDKMPSMGEKSPQTIGRRIDALHAKGILESCIVAPDDLNREMIIGYKLTPDGRALLAQKQQAVLRDKVRRSLDALLTGDTTEPSIKRDALISIMIDEFDIDDRTQELLTRLETTELLGLVAAHYFLTNVDNTFNSSNEGTVLAVLEHTPGLRHPFEQWTLINRICDSLRTTQDTSQEQVESTDTIQQSP